MHYIDTHGLENRWLAYDYETGLMWVWTPRRTIKYTCSLGDVHKQYWRTHWRQGRDDYFACTDEVVHATPETT